MGSLTSERRFTVALLCLVGVAASGCERSEVRPSETRTRSAELTAASRGADEIPLTPADAGDLVREPAPQVPSVTREAEAPRTADDRPRERVDPRFDAGRLSIIGSPGELERNLGLVREQRDGSAGLTAAPPPAAAAPPIAPQMGAGAVETPPPPLRREGAGRPGAGGAPYQ